jgi:hypothetical protein
MTEQLIQLIVLTVCVIGAGIFYAVQKHRLQTRHARIAKYARTLEQDLLAETNRANQLAEERPWVPIVFSLNSVETTERSVRFRAAGRHREYVFGFAVVLTMSHGPVALCEWSRDGAISEGLLDILAHYGGVSRGDNRFDELVRTSAIILQAEPPNVPFAQVTQLRSKVCFELAEDQPEIYLNLDFLAGTGCIDEKDLAYRKQLVHAFQASS